MAVRQSNVIAELANTFAVIAIFFSLLEFARELSDLRDLVPLSHCLGALADANLWTTFFAFTSFLFKVSNVFNLPIHVFDVLRRL